MRALLSEAELYEYELYLDEEEQQFSDEDAWELARKQAVDEVGEELADYVANELVDSGYEVRAKSASRIVVKFNADVEDVAHEMTSLHRAYRVLSVKVSPLRVHGHRRGPSRRPRARRSPTRTTVASRGDPSRPRPVDLADLRVAA